jgi:hypothetical protein
MPPYSYTPILRNAWISQLPVDGTNMDTVDLYRSIDQDDFGSSLAYEFPVGTVIVHEAVDREEPHGVEVKRDDYVDNGGRDWWMRMINDEGTIEPEGTREPCEDCHNNTWRASEGLWGVPTFVE